MDWDTQRVQAHIGVGPVKPAGTTPKGQRTQETPGAFRDALEKARTSTTQPDVHVSAHAAQRLMQRGIALDTQDLQKISEGFDRAAEKGAKESLFVLRDMALIVSVDNRTVITALQGENAKENVFTKIDSAVLL